MNYRVLLSIEASDDLRRLVAHLQEANPQAAGRARATLLQALDSLASMPERARPIAAGVRELPVKFGHYGYALRYIVEEQVVFVTRIRHVREQP